LKRGGPLQRRTPLKSTGRLSRTPKPKKASEPSRGRVAPVREYDLEELKPLVRERDDHRCAKCGRGGSLHVHHRQLRSQGGPDVASNLLTLCFEHHHWAHEVDRKLALMLGIIVEGRAGAAYDVIPVLYHDGSLRMLRQDLCFEYVF
jgi:5-methylcytosine-specific restriction endonuclease McrA